MSLSLLSLNLPPNCQCPAASNADWPAHLCGPSCGGTVQDELLKTALVSHILAGKYKKTRGQDGRHKPVSGHGEGRYLRTCFGGKTGGQACDRKVITCFSRNLEEKTVTIVDLSSKERERRPVLDCNAPGELRSLVKLHLSYEDNCCCYTIVSEKEGLYRIVKQMWEIGVGRRHKKLVTQSRAGHAPTF